MVRPMTIEHAVPGFLPSQHGFHFPNRWPPGTPALRWRASLTGPVPIAAELSVGDAANGLCGGMAFAAADLWAKGASPPPDREAPGAGSAAFGYLVRRQLDSLDWGLTVLAFYRLAAASDRGRARATVDHAWPRIRGDLDRGGPSIVGLLHVASPDPRRLTANHQVVAYGYRLAAAERRVTISVYDPNHPDDDTIRLGLELTGNETSLSIVYGASDPPVIGLCSLRHHPADPKPLTRMNR